MASFSGAGSARFFWIVPPTIIIDNIERTRRKTLLRCQEIWTDTAGDVESWMKDNHPWRNRTYTAEDSLTAEVGAYDIKRFGPIARSAGDLSMEIGYDLNVMRQHPDGRQRDYSIYLEGYLGLGIIRPTMEYWGPIIMDEFEGAMTF